MLFENIRFSSNCPYKFGKFKGTICGKKIGNLSFTFDKLSFGKLSLIPQTPHTGARCSNKSRSGTCGRPMVRTGVSVTHMDGKRRNGEIVSYCETHDTMHDDFSKTVQVFRTVNWKTDYPVLLMARLFEMFHRNKFDR